MSAFPKTTSLWVKVEYPLKQGLKLIGNPFSFHITFVKVEYPLKQGLKQFSFSLKFAS